MKLFIKLFNYLTNNKYNNIDMDVFMKCKNIDDILNIYLTLKGFRKTCLISFQFNKINIKEFEKLFNVKVYKFENKSKKIKGFLVSTLKTNKIKKLAEDYEKYIYNSNKCTQKKKDVQKKMGEELDFITPGYFTNGIGLYFKIYYCNKFITCNIYEQTLDRSLGKDQMMKLCNKYETMNKILKRLSDGFRVEIKLQ